MNYKEKLFHKKMSAQLDELLTVINDLPKETQDKIFCGKNNKMRRISPEIQRRLIRIRNRKKT